MKVLARLLGLTVVALVLASTTLTAPPIASASARHYCHGHRATISAGARDNKIVGTTHRDVIWAGAGKDRVLGRGGNDLICGGPGRDVIDGQAGGDTIYGGGGRDWCVAWRVPEHRRHHGCDVHVGLHDPGSAPRTAAVVSKVAAATPSFAVPSKVSDRRRVADCEAAGTCDAGVVVCGAAQFDYLTAPGVQMPSAYTQDGGLLAVSVNMFSLQNDGTFAVAYTIPWKAYQVGSGWYSLPPAQTLVRLPSVGGVSYMTAYFTYSGDGGATWSAPQGANEKKYIFNTYSGWGQYHGDGNLVTGECNLS